MGNAHASPALPTGGPPDKSVMLVSIASCSACGKVVGDDTQALQCDRCLSADSWKCAECLDLSGDMYERLMSSDLVSIRWFCDGCDKLVMAEKGTADYQNDKIDHLISVIEKLVTRYEDIEKRLDSKCSVHDASKLDARIQHLEEQLSKRDSDMQSKLSSLQDQLMMTSEGSNLEKEQVVSDAEMIKCVDELNRKTEEEQDAERRKRNIILYRVPEKNTESATDRKTSDTVFVKDILDCVFNIKVGDHDIDKMYRLGRWSGDTTRPLLVAFKSEEMKEEVMANLRNLKYTADKFRGIGVSHDLPPKEREEIKSMIQEAKREHIENCSEGETVENYRFLVVGKGLKKRVLKIKKNAAAHQ